MLDLEGFYGCVSVRKKDAPPMREAYGWRDIPNRIPNRINTRFATASAGKAFVATGIMQLAEKGALRLDDTLGDIRPFPLGKINPRITLRQLLNHTSGMADYFDESVMDDYAQLWHDFPNYRVRRSSDLIPLFNGLPSVSAPGERFSYNNAGFIALDLVIERITGLPFDRYLAENVFSPAGMTGTGYFELDRLPENCANAYIFDESTGEYYLNIFSIDCKGTGAGGAYMSVMDVEAFWDALLDGKLVSERSLAAMWTPAAGDGDGLYGLGFWLDRSDGDTPPTPHIEGCDPGVCFFSRLRPATRETFTIVSNNAYDVWRVAARNP